MNFLTAILAILLDIVPAGKAYVMPLQQRDSILIADQIEYGFRLDSVKAGTAISLPDFSPASNDTLTLVSNWRLDTLKIRGSRRKPASRLFDIRARVVLAPFEEGIYRLPSIPVRREFDGRVDTLVFEGAELDVKTMPVDTATFEIHDIKGQMKYPLTFAEVAPWLALAWLIAVIVIVVGCIVNIRASRVKVIDRPQDPAHILALRELDKFRGDKFWAADKQKHFYSGVTDILKVYMEDRFGIDAPEMTTAELFDALKKEESLTPELYGEMKDLFETADFVKFAKLTVTDEDNAKVLPLSVRFVTSTYQTNDI